MLKQNLLSHASRANVSAIKLDLESTKHPGGTSAVYGSVKCHCQYAISSIHCSTYSRNLSSCSDRHVLATGV